MQMMIDVAWIEVTLNPPIVNGKTQGQNTVLLKFLAKFLKDTDRMNYVFQGVVGNRDIDATIRNLLQRLVTLNAVLDGIECYESLEEIPDGCIDVAISNHALEHVIHPIGILKELRKKLKENGILTLCL